MSTAFVYILPISPEWFVSAHERRKKTRRQIQVDLLYLGCFPLKISRFHWQVSWKGSPYLPYLLMEYFRTVDISTTEQIIQEVLVLEKMEEMTNELILLDLIDDKSASVGGIWGEFTLERSTINGGLRFALKECPNALVWTITTGYPPAIDSLVIHLTLNRMEKSMHFIEEVEEFLDDHCKHIHTYLSKTPVLKIDNRNRLLG